MRPTSAEEVARVVSLAAESGSELAVRSGGHSLAGHSVSDGGIVLDLAELTALDIDLEGGTAWAQTGLTAGAYTGRWASTGWPPGSGTPGRSGSAGSPWAAGSGTWSASTG